MDIWNFLRDKEKYNVEIINEIESEYNCTICRKLLINPVNLECGCRYCRSCIETYLSNDNNKNCPNSCEITDLEIHEDFGAKGKICQLMVKCLNEECNETMNLKNIVKHLDQCKNMKTCIFKPLGCDSGKLNLDEMENHLKDNNDAHLTFIVQVVEENKKQLESYSENQNKIIDELRRENETLREELKQFVEQQSSNQETLEALTKKLGNIETDGDSEKMEKYIDNNDDVINEDKYLKLEKFNHEIEKLNGSISMIESMVRIGFNWLISDFISKRQSIPRSKNILSKAIYLHGYKFCFRLYPNGMKDNSYISIGAFLMPGIYDEQLLWPMPYELSINLLSKQNATDQKASNDQLNSLVENTVTNETGSSRDASVSSDSIGIKKVNKIFTSYSFRYSCSKNRNNYSRPITTGNKENCRVLLEVVENFVSYKSLITAPGLLNDDTLTIQVSLI